MFDLFHLYSRQFHYNLGVVYIFNMYIIIVQTLKAVAFIQTEFQITQTYVRTNRRSRAATRPAVTVGDTGKRSIY